MSKIGNNPINLPENVSIITENENISFSGNCSTVNYVLPNFLKIDLINKKLYVRRIGNERHIKACHGLVRALIQNIIIGITKGFSNILIAEGVGYRFQINENILILNIGFSHQVQLKIPININIKLESPTKLIITGINKESVNSFTHQIRAIKPPDPYTGAGLFFENEIIKRKAGKTGKKKKMGKFGK